MLQDIELVEEILRLQNTVCFLQAQLGEARKMQENWFVAHPEVMRYILQHEQAQELIGRMCAEWDQLQATPSYCERFVSPSYDDIYQVEAYRREYEQGQALIVIPMLDPIIHTDEHPYCGDETCPCMDELYDKVERRGIV